MRRVGPRNVLRTWYFVDPTAGQYQVLVRRVFGVYCTFFFPRSISEAHRRLSYFCRWNIAGHHNNNDNNKTVNRQNRKEICHEVNLDY